MRRIAAVIATGSLTAGLLVLPVVSLPSAVAAPTPVSPRTTTIPLLAVDAGAAASVVSGPAVPGAPGGATTKAARRDAVLTPETPLPDPADVVGISWDGRAEAGTRVTVRVREDGRWTGWQELGVTEHGPDPDSVEGRQARQAVEPLVTAGADAVQVRIETPSGRAPRGAALVAVDSPAAPADAAPAVQPAAYSTAATSAPLSTAAAAAAKPTIITRAQWGADESRRNGGPYYSDTIKVGFVHHTTGRSTYSETGAFEFVRALYDYYTTPSSQGGPGYSDLAYNFLVDRFGRLFEGRAGGMDKPVIGGHTAGFNKQTFAVSALGDFEINDLTPALTPRNPDGVPAMVDSIARLLAWKLGMYGRDPFGTAQLVSNFGGGTSRYQPGEVATTPVISGHGDIGNTDCPGKHLHTYLPTIRTKAKGYMGGAVPPPPPPAIVKPSWSPRSPTWSSASGATVTATTSRPLHWTAEVRSLCQDEPVRVLTGVQSAAGALSVRWDLKDALGRWVPPGEYRVTLSGKASNGDAPPVATTVKVATTPRSPFGPCPAVDRLSAADRYALSVAAGRSVSPRGRSVVLAPGLDASLVYALLAVPFARAKGAPLLLTSGRALSASVAADLRARGATTVYVVGSPQAIPPAMDDSLRRLGYRVVRLGGADPYAVSASVAMAQGVTSSRAAVAVSMYGNGWAEAVTAAGPAARLGRPLLLVRRDSVPAPVAAAVRTLGIRAVIVAGGPRAVGDAVVRALPRAVRVGAADLPASQLAQLKVWSGPVPLTDLAASPMDTANRLAAVVAATLGRTTLPVATGGLPTVVAQWLSGRADRRRVWVVASHTAVPDATLGTLNRLMVGAPLPDTVAGDGTAGAAPAGVAPAGLVMSGTGAAGAGPTTQSPGGSVARGAAVGAGSVTVRLAVVRRSAASWRGVAGLASAVRAAGTATPTPPTPTSPTTPPSPAPPAGFTLTGSGWGHGIGLSQTGALGQAREGRTAEQILTHYYTGTQVVPVRDDVALRVNLIHRATSALVRVEPLGDERGMARRAVATDGRERLVVYVDGRLVRLANPGEVIGLRSTSAGVTVTRTVGRTVRVLGTGAVVAIRWSGTRYAGRAGGQPSMVNVVRGGESFRSAGHRYRYGAIDVRPRTGGGGFEVVNTVRLRDEYLYGIAEVPAEWPVEALKAQVVAARSFALAKYGTGRVKVDCWCHVDDGPGGPYYDQTFAGWDKVDGASGPLWRAAVDATLVAPASGLAVTYHGTVIPAYYGDGTGGRTQNNEDVWGGTPLPWARSVDDHWSTDPALNPTFALWTRTRSQAAVAAAFGLPDVVSLSVTDRFASGGVRTAVARSSTGGRASLTGERLRSRLGLPSTYVKGVALAR